jgi:hypothetical protein
MKEFEERDSGGVVTREAREQIRAIAMAAIDRLGARSPAALMASDPMLLRYFGETFLASHNALDSAHCGRHCVIGSCGRTLSFDGQAGTVLAKNGYSHGVHRWEVDVVSTGRMSWLGVSERPSSNIDRYLGGPATGYAVCGNASGDRGSAAVSGGNSYETVPIFTRGSTVMFELDSDAGVLRYHLNGKHVANLQFGGRLAGKTLYPAFSQFQGETMFTIRFTD